MSWYNPYILIPLSTWIIAQLSKTLIAAIKSHDRFDIRYLYASGGMPSAHSAVVCSLAVTALLRNGITSAIFGLAAIFAAIVMYDSFGVRRAAGEQAAAINVILETLSKQRLGFSHPQARLREILGHKPLEVTVGAITGVVFGLLLNASYLSSQINWLVNFPTRLESMIDLAASAVVIIIGILVSLIIGKRYKTFKSFKVLTKHILVMAFSVGVVGLILGFAGYQKALYLGWRVWFYIAVALAIIWMVTLVGIFSKSLPQQMIHEVETQRIRKWLPTKRKAGRKG